MNGFNNPSFYTRESERSGARFRKLNGGVGMPGYTVNRIHNPPPNSVFNRRVNIAERLCCMQGRSLKPYGEFFFTVAVVSSAPRFHLCACMKSSAAADPGIWSEVGAVLGFLSHALAASGLSHRAVVLPVQLPTAS